MRARVRRVRTGDWACAPPLTDARTHRGTRVRRDDSMGEALPWRLLGMNSARMDMGSRDLVLDTSLGLNSAWYADIPMTLTAPRAVNPPTKG